MSAHGRSEGSVIGHPLLTFAYLLINVLLIAIVLRAVISWFPIGPANPLIKVLNDVTEPILAPLRRVVPQLGTVDITPMIAIIVLYVIKQAISQAG